MIRRANSRGDIKESINDQTFENLPRANSIMAHGLYGKAKYNDRIHQMNSNLFIFHSPIF